MTTPPPAPPAPALPIDIEGRVRSFAKRAAADARIVITTEAAIEALVREAVVTALARTPGRLVEPSGLPLVWSDATPDKLAIVAPVVTVPHAHRWACYYVVSPDCSIRRLRFDDVAQGRLNDVDGPAAVDGVPNPAYLHAFVETHGLRIDRLAGELVLGRWVSLTEGPLTKRPATAVTATNTPPDPPRDVRQLEQRTFTTASGAVINQAHLQHVADLVLKHTRRWSDNEWHCIEFDLSSLFPTDKGFRNTQILALLDTPRDPVDGYHPNDLAYADALWAAIPEWLAQQASLRETVRDLAARAAPSPR